MFNFLVINLLYLSVCYILPTPTPLPGIVDTEAGSSCGLVPISAVYYIHFNLEAVCRFFLIVIDSKQIVNIGSVRHNPELVPDRRML